MKKSKILLLLFAAVASFVLYSCNKTSNSIPLSSGITLINMDKLVKPGDNFDAYVNGQWKKNTKMPADKSFYGVTEMVNDKAEENIKKIIEESAKGNFKEGSDEQKIGDLYNSFMDQKARDAKGIAPLLPVFKKIDAIANYDDLAAYFGTTTTTRDIIPFFVGVAPDLKNPTKNILIFWQSGIGLLESEYYLLNDQKAKDIRTKYLEHITNMMRLSKIQNPEIAATKILALETKIASKHMKKEDTQNFDLLYNKYKVQDLPKLMPNFNWKLFFDNAGISNPNEILVTQTDYMKALDQIITTTPLDTWKTYLKWIKVGGAANALSSDFEKESFNFYEKFLSGKTTQTDLWRRGVQAVNNNLGQITGKLYVKKHFPSDAKAKVKLLVDNIIKAYELSIAALDWMSPETKKHAQAKLTKLTLKLAYPDKWRDYSGLKIVKGDYYGNLMRVAAFEYNFEISKNGKNVDRSEWLITPQTISAYYLITANEIVFPAGILQSPFFDPNVDDAVNYGSIGSVIGHEIGHAFDDRGSGFDGDGVMRNWWTPNDKKAFKQKTATLVGQYNEFKVFPDLKLNGTYTLAENIADLSGLAITLKAYQLSLKGKKSPVLDGFTGEQRLFIGYAQSWLQTAREEGLRLQIANDSHSPAKYRINAVIRNIPEFYTAFGVKPSDSLYLAPEKRIKIWE